MITQSMSEHKLRKKIKNIFLENIAATKISSEQ